MAKNIRVPDELYERLKALAQQKKVPIWKVILEALSCYENVEKKASGLSKLPRLDKAAWYAYKLSASVGSFREKPTEGNLALLTQTAKQVEERLGVKTDLLIKVAAEYHKKPSTQNKIELNDTAKLVVGDIIAKMLFEQ